MTSQETIAAIREIFPQWGASLSRQKKHIRGSPSEAWNVELETLQLWNASVVRPTLFYISKMLKKGFLRVTLNEVKGLMYLKRRDSSLRSE